MLISFKVINFRSFFEEQELGLFSSKVTKFKDHVYKTNSRILPGILKGALIYGANASGKSNLVKALDFSKKIIISQNKSNWNIPIFKLSENPLPETHFTYELLLDSKCYKYSFIIREGLINKENLSVVTKESENNIFERYNDGEKVIINFNLNFKDGESKKFHETIYKGTRTNQLFLNFINEQNPTVIEEVFKKIFFWFRYKLTVFFPDTKLLGTEIQLLKDKDLWEYFNKCLNFFDTGIDKLDYEEFNIEDPKFHIPEFIKEDIKQKLHDEKAVYTVNSNKNDIYYIKKQTGQLVVKKIKAAHEIKNNQSSVLFDFSDESDGTNRIMDLIPMLYLLEKGNTVVIDEIDRSFHSLISLKLFELFYKNTFSMPAQLIATTHDLSLLSLKNFRRDEIWFIKKDASKQSVLYSLEEFKPRFDKQLRDAYLDGRFGAVPVLTDAEV